jgi:hypothetical protein
MNIDMSLVSKARELAGYTNRAAGTLERTLKQKGNHAAGAKRAYVYKIKSVLDRYVAMTNMLNDGYSAAEELAVAAELELIELVG